MRINFQKEQSYQTIRRWIEDGVLQRGSQFPAERDLCKKLGVSLSTVHRAVIELERGNIVLKKSPRIRFIAQGKAPKPAMDDSLKNTVIIVSPRYREDSPLYFKRPGWGYYNYIAIFVAIQNKGCNTLMVTPENFDSEIDTHVRNRPFGVVFTENGGLPPFENTQVKLRRAGIPFVAYGNFPGMDRVTCDHFTGTYELAQHLVSKGCRRISMLIQDQNMNGYWIQDRLGGLKKAVKEAGLKFLPPIMEMPAQGVCGRTEQEYFKARATFSAGCLAPSLLGSNPPDAIMLLSDWLVPQVSTACEILGKKPNQNIFIAGYDNFYDESPDYKLNPVPPVATVDKLLAESGRKMAEILFSRAAGDLPPEPQMILMTPKLITVETEDMLNLKGA